MTYIITSPCVDELDLSCVDVCPVDCIYYEDGVDRMLYIEPEECIDCAACEPVCPVAAIFPEEAVPAGEKNFIALNYGWFKDKQVTRDKLNELKPKV
jgi:NAD-dependent dihydropyrimidine dehydrogenase PreA subunit|tara:strand:+ start:3360 stop:3650 length:291 start_codon:yes stop_codon:yes gene_type:complete